MRALFEINGNERAAMQDRVLRHCMPEPNSGCWLWMAHITTCGYGGSSYRRAAVYAHRLSYAAFKGAIEGHQEIDHLCRVRDCVNPDHLEAVSHRTNMLRGETLGGKNVKKSTCPKGHHYHQTIERGGVIRRRCRTCDNERKRNPPPDRERQTCCTPS
jgi:hypothetical protein